MISIKSRPPVDHHEEYRKEHKSLQVEMTGQEFATLENAAGDVSISEAARQIIDHYIQQERESKLVTFWVDNASYSHIQSRANAANMSLKGYIRQLFSDYFRETAGDSKIEKITAALNEIKALL